MTPSVITFDTVSRPFWILGLTLDANISTLNMNANELIETATHDDFFVLRGLLAPADVFAARAELLALLDEDLAERAKRNITAADWTNDGGFSTSLTLLMHTRLFPSWQSARLASLIVQIIEEPSIAEFVRRVIGEHYRLRVDLVRRASGINDAASDGGPPHTWHRDTPGEFTFGIFLDHMTPPLSGGTCAMRGTHMLPLHPLWDLVLAEDTLTAEELYLLGGPTRIPRAVQALMPFNRVLRRAMVPRAEEIRGMIGDIYFFFNDVWHGRAPNAQGKAFMTVRFGGFPTDFAFKNDLQLPPGIERLPPALRRSYAPSQPVNERGRALIHRNRTKSPSRLMNLAHIEKRLAVAGLQCADWRHGFGIGRMFGPKRAA
ncbi:MAG: hypothetical protein KGJ66_10840 [Alphaproteobacteria bacterium]|nr:hypothetical protein [Alphaproteobacteria bacterium]